jgi:hypothetical protein
MDLNQVTLPSRDVGRGAAFYRKLGLVQIVEDLPKYARFELPEGTATLSLELRDGGVDPVLPHDYFPTAKQSVTRARAFHRRQSVFV